MPFKYLNDPSFLRWALNREDTHDPYIFFLCKVGENSIHPDAK